MRVALSTENLIPPEYINIFIHEYMQLRIVSRLVIEQPGRTRRAGYSLSCTISAILLSVSTTGLVFMLDPRDWGTIRSMSFASTLNCDNRGSRNRSVHSASRSTSRYCAASSLETDEIVDVARFDAGVYQGHVHGLASHQRSPRC
ncbi:MAG: hypothetical protein AABY62_10345 [Pseudomonadota bacterium]